MYLTGCKNGGSQFYRFVRVQGISDGVVNLLLLRHDGRDQTQGPEGQGSGHGVVGVDHGEDPAKKFVHIGDFVLKSERPFVIPSYFIR